MRRHGWRPSLVRDPVPTRDGTPASRAPARPPIPSTGPASAGRDGPEPANLFHEPQRSPGNQADPKPSPTAHRSDHHLSPGGPSKLYKPSNWDSLAIATGQQRLDRPRHGGPRGAHLAGRASDAGEFSAELTDRPSACLHDSSARARTGQVLGCSVNTQGLGIVAFQQVSSRLMGRSGLLA